MEEEFDEWIDIDADGDAYVGAGGRLVAEARAGYGGVVDLTVYNPFTRRIIGCAMQVHSLLGSGFPEVIYQRALSIELEREGVAAQREVETPIFFRGQQIGTRRVDFLAAGPTAEQPILVELKAVSELTTPHFAQLINYLEAYRLHVGLLLNFGAPSLQYRRFIKTSFAT